MYKAILYGESILYGEVLPKILDQFSMQLDIYLKESVPVTPCYCLKQKIWKA